MEGATFFSRIKQYVLNFAETQKVIHTKIPISKFGTIKYRFQQYIAEVPFLYPTLILVLSGKKLIFLGDKELKCSSGECFAIPTPSKYDVVNLPDAIQGSFLALYVCFETSLIEQFRYLYKFDETIKADNASIHLKGSELLYSSILHFLEISEKSELNDDLLKHTLMEVLLCLVRYHNGSRMLMSTSDIWRDRVHSLLLSNPSRSWQVNDVCKHLHVSESTLRRKLRKESTDFRTIIDDVRMGLALSEVQFTDLPISTIAINCGYSSFSRFTSRFQQRFGTTPSQLRKGMAV